MHTYMTEMRRIRRGDKEILRYTHKIFQPEGLEIICAFYRDVAANCLDFCEGTLADSLPPSGAQKYCYSLKCEPTFCNEDKLCIRLEAMLYKSRSEIEQHYSSTQIWDTHEQIIIKS